MYSPPPYRQVNPESSKTYYKLPSPTPILQSSCSVIFLSCGLVLLWAQSTTSSVTPENWFCSFFFGIRSFQRFSHECLSSRTKEKEEDGRLHSRITFSTVNSTMTPALFSYTCTLTSLVFPFITGLRQGRYQTLGSGQNGRLEVRIRYPSNFVFVNEQSVFDGDRKIREPGTSTETMSRFVWRKGTKTGFRETYSLLSHGILSLLTMVSYNYIQV